MLRSRVFLGGQAVSMQAVTLGGAVLAGAMAGLLGNDPRPVFAAAGILTLGTVAGAWFAGLRKAPRAEVANLLRAGGTAAG
jgi:hypothetical protein